jgi:hypothetical protein
MASVICVYKNKIGDREHGVIRIPKDGINFDEYVRRHAEKGIEILRFKMPSMKTIEKHYFEDGVVCTPDGCEVETDGVCEHGYPSILKIRGLI